jgi:hypothetical protein
LNLWADQSSQAVIDFLDSGITVYNPAVAGITRFEDVHDSHSPPQLVSNRTAAQVDANMVDGFGESSPILRYGLQGFSVDGGGGRGLSSTCDGDSLCYPTAGGAAWLLASIPYKMMKSSGTANYHLQVGYIGMNHRGDESGDMSILFGNGTGPTYSAAIVDRERTKSLDTPDLILTAIPSPAGDYNHDGIVDAADYTVWRDTFGQSGSGLDADGDGNNQVNGADYTYWKTRFGNIHGEGATSITTGVPEPRVLSLSAIAILYQPLRLRRRVYISTRSRL